jgi:hypothetical protein
MLFTLVQHERGNPEYKRGEGYALCAMINSCMAASMSFVVTPTYTMDGKSNHSSALGRATMINGARRTLTKLLANTLTFLASPAAFLILVSPSEFSLILPSPSQGSALLPASWGHPSLTYCGRVIDGGTGRTGMWDVPNWKGSGGRIIE